MPQDTPNPLLSQRLLQDIHELRRKPYPNIDVHINDKDLTKFCLILSPPRWDRMHLTVDRLQKFPLSPPRIRMDSRVIHPNVFGTYICASILNTSEGYTPAYTLKNIAIQILSFFASETLEQVGSGEEVDINAYRTKRNPRNLGILGAAEDNFCCDICKFGPDSRKELGKRVVPGAVYVGEPTPPRKGRRNRKSKMSTDGTSSEGGSSTSQSTESSARTVFGDYNLATLPIDTVPNEILLKVLHQVEEFEDLVNLAIAWPRVSRVITKFDVLRQRELQCFVQKKTYHDVNLGVGIAANTKSIRSEFDLISEEAYNNLEVRESIHHVPFRWWLPLPISRPHWARVRGQARETLRHLRLGGSVKNPTIADVIYQFMTDIVVKLNNVGAGYDDPKSTLTHASDKAIESYFHLFHLLVCLATEDPSIVRSANRLLTSFRDGRGHGETEPISTCLAAGAQDLDGHQRAIPRSEESNCTKMVINGCTTCSHAHVADFGSQHHHEGNEPAILDAMGEPGCNARSLEVSISENHFGSIKANSRLRPRSKEPTRLDASGSSRDRSSSPDHDFGSQFRDRFGQHFGRCPRQQDVSHLLAHSYGYPSDISVGCGGESRNSLVSSESGRSDQYSDTGGIDGAEYQEPAPGHRHSRLGERRERS
ncbi:hypothetical protein G7054_g3968 [Neopestalotiopsis clavispora]|nr:hypothetical protein G7054_g3968 [Neopestalotiopsis clavispora]